MKRSVWLRLFLPAALVILAAAAVILLTARADAGSREQEQAFRSLRFSAERHVGQLAGLIAERFEELEMFARALPAGELTVETALSLLRTGFPETGLRRTAVVSANGIAYYGDGVTADVAGEEGVLRSLNGERAADLRIGDRGLREGRIVLSVPAAEQAAAGWAVLCGITDEALTGLLSASCGPEETALLVSAEGSVLSMGGAGGLSVSGEEITGEAPLAEALRSGDSGCCVLTFPHLDLKLYAAYAPAGLNGWMLICCKPVDSVEFGLVPVLAVSAAALAALAGCTALFSARLRCLDAERLRQTEYGVQAEAALRSVSAGLLRFDPASEELSVFPRPSGFPDEAEKAPSPALPGQKEPELPSVRVSPDSRRAFRLLLGRLKGGERVVREVLRMEDGKYLRLSFRNRFDQAGEPCGASGCFEDWTLRQDVRRRFDRQVSRLEDSVRDYVLGVCWNLSRNTLEKTVGLPENGSGTPGERLLAVLAPKDPSELSSLTAGRLLWMHDVCADLYELEFRRAGEEGLFRLETYLLRSPDTLDVCAFLFLTGPRGPSAG